ncbi:MULTISPECIES: hypothetical protein [unclassified Halomonas]|uniref:hypothetical protein n=1 Tax=unclassified Halomonas TaxID=2609666 RepID=UPI001CF1D8C9|nr:MULTISPECIES: hypothetical protein [unclassified Halomonas]UZH08668.1 hypothetical protein OM794_15010 [Halomonas sp. BDJS001]
MIASKSFRWNECRAVAAVLGTVVMGLSADAQSDEQVLDTLQVHGFLSQALVITDDNNFFGHSSRDEGSLEFTEVGLNVSLRPHQDVLVAAQVLSRRAGGDISDAEPKLDYGLIDYQMISNQQRNFGVQLGRIKNPFGFYNQTRDVAFTRPSILLPQSIYFDRTRSMALTGDGVTFYLEERLNNGVLRGQVGLGEPQAGDDLNQTLQLNRIAGTFDPQQSAIAQVRYEHDGGRVVAAVSKAEVKSRIKSHQPGVSDGDFYFTPWVFSLQYNQELWSLTAEYALRRSGLKNFDQSSLNFDTTGESWYLQYTRRFYDDWQWLIRYDSLISNRNDASGKAYEANGQGPAHTQFADDLTFGLQWTPHPQVMLAGEYHHVDGTGWLPIQDNPDSSATSRRWNMWLFQLSLRF